MSLWLQQQFCNWDWEPNQVDLVLLNMDRLSSIPSFYVFKEKHWFINPRSLLPGTFSSLTGSDSLQHTHKLLQTTKDIFILYVEYTVFLKYLY